MSEGHSCADGQAEITFMRDGVCIQRWLRLCGESGQYWGGWTWNESPGMPTHMTVTEHWMFQQIAQFAHDPANVYELTGHGWRTTISTRMEADRIAGPLACDPRRVRHYFALSVEVPEPGEVTV